MKQALNEDIEIGISGIRKLIQTVKEVYNTDLSVYASTFLKRRVSKIMNIHNLKNLDELIEKIHQQEFFSSFIKHLTVEGTEFFRDPGFWRYFRDEICPSLARNLMRIKIWIPGCSTGEEVLSMAITLKEAGIYDKCTILATDLNKEIIEKSRERFYSHSKLEISENNFKRFLEDESSDMQKYIKLQTHGFQILPALFENINYEVLDNYENCKIRGINVVLCRNYFIYFTAQYQDKLFSIFTEGLNQNGILAIGNKENIAFCHDEGKYVLIDDKEKIYKKVSQ